MKRAGAGRSLFTCIAGIVLVSILQVSNLAAASLTAEDAPAAARTQLVLRNDAAAPVGGLAGCLQAIPGKPEYRLPGSPDYELYANGLRVMEPKTPAAVVFPDTGAQVQAAVLCATKHGAPPVPRSGGCSFENLGTADGALVIDLSNMAAVRVDPKAMTVTAQAGIRMGNLYYEIFRAGRAAGGRNLTCLGGTYPQIGFGGILAAGGYGVLSRKYGLLSDSLISATVVDAKGRLLEASEKLNPDLLFALKGGGGGTYGIVVEATVRLLEIPVVTLARIKYANLEKAVQLFDRYQRWAPDAPAELTFKFNLKPDKIDITMQYLGPKKDLDRLLKDKSGLILPGSIYEATQCDIQGSRGWTPEASIVPAGPKGGWKTVSHLLVPPYCSPPEETRVPQRVRPGGLLAFMSEAAQYRSALFKTPITISGVEALKEAFSAPTTRAWRQMLCRALGPGITKVPPAASAFGHREARLMCEWGVSFGMRKTAAQQPAAVTAPIWAWFERTRGVVAALSEAGAEYNGWINRFDRVENYFGTNYPRLQQIKKKYDPDNVFFNSLSVKPARR